MHRNNVPCSRQVPHQIELDEVIRKAGDLGGRLPNLFARDLLDFRLLDREAAGRRREDLGPVQRAYGGAAEKSAHYLKIVGKMACILID